MFHFELRQFPHSARAFNLEEDELHRRVVAPWLAGRTIEWSERSWSPERARLKIISGPALRPDELGMGRGWPEAQRAGEDVTEQILAAAQGFSGGDAPLERLKRELLERSLTAPQPLAAALVAASELLPGRRVSERLALAEQAVWELLHERRIELRGPGGAQAAPLPEAQWQPQLLTWVSWTDAAGPVLVALAPEG